MDEFVAFHRLACTSPFAHFNTFREGCDAHRLDLGFLSYHTSYGYIGIASSGLYFPFWKLWSAPASFYLQGVILLLVFGYGMARGLGLRPADALLPVCYFPIAYSMLHDTGPVRLGLLSLPALLLIATRIAGSDRTVARVAYALVAAGLVIICVEDKPYYLIVMPMVLVVVCAIVVSRVATFPTIRHIWIPLTVFVLVVGAGLAVLLGARMPEGLTYYAYLRAQSRPLEASLATQMQRIVYYTSMFPLYGHRVFAVHEVPFPLKLATAVPVIWFALYLWRARAVPNWTLAACGVAYVVGIAALLVTGSAASGHHYVFLHLPIVVLLMISTTQSATRPATFSFVVITTAMSIGFLSATPVLLDSSWERRRVFDYASLPEVAATHVINFSSWGGYYHQELYGERTQIVTFVDPLTPEGGSQLARVARATSRDVLNICLNCDEDDMLHAFQGATAYEVSLGGGHWRAFRVRFE